MLDELRKLFKHTSVYGAGNMLGKLVGFFMIPIYTRYLGPGDYGILELLDLSLMLTGVLMTMWMNASIVRYYYDYKDTKDKNEVVSTSLYLSIFIGIFVAALGMAWARQLSMLVLKTPSYYFLIYLVAVSFFLSSVKTVCWSYLRARQRSTLIVSLDMAMLVLLLGFNIYFIAIVKIGLIGILYSNLIASLLVTSLMTVLTLREVNLGFSAHKLRQLVTFGSPLVLTSIAAFTVNFSDRFFLQRFGSVSDVGIYALGYKFGFMLSFLLVQPFQLIWSAQMYEIDRKEHAGEIFARVFRYYGLLLIGVGLAISMLIKEVVSVIAAPSFHSAYKIVPLVTLAYIFQGMSQFFLAGLYIKKKTTYIGAIGFVSAGVNLLLNFFLIRAFLGMGGAYATALSFFFVLALTFWAAQRVHPLPAHPIRLLVPLSVAAIIYLSSTLIADLPLVFAVCVKLLLWMALPVALYLWGFFEPREIEKAKEALNLVLVRYGWRAAAQEQ